MSNHAAKFSSDTVLSYHRRVRGSYSNFRACIKIRIAAFRSGQQGSSELERGDSRPEWVTFDSGAVSFSEAEDEELKTSPHVTFSPETAARFGASKARALSRIVPRGLGFRLPTTAFAVTFPVRLRRRRPNQNDAPGDDALSIKSLDTFNAMNPEEQASYLVRELKACLAAMKPVHLKSPGHDINSPAIRCIRFSSDGSCLAVAGCV